MFGYTECQKPGCSKEPEETYTGANGNRLKLCERHYYKLVSKGAGKSDDDSGPLYPFWDSGIRCNTTDTGHVRIRNLNSGSDGL